MPNYIVTYNTQDETDDEYFNYAMALLDASLLCPSVWVISTPHKASDISAWTRNLVGGVKTTVVVIEIQKDWGGVNISKEAVDWLGTHL